LASSILVSSSVQKTGDVKGYLRIKNLFSENPFFGEITVSRATNTAEGYLLLLPSSW